MAKILLVEDDFALAMGTQYTLEAEGYDVVHAENIKAAMQAVQVADQDMPDLILLDVMLPDGNGYDFCREFRKVNQTTPIIFLTAVSEEVNIVQGLELGADDYVAKPYRVKELLSRITANLRRASIAKGNVGAGQSNTGSAARATAKQEYYFGEHRLDLAGFRLYRGETMVDVTAGELRLLRELVVNAGQVLTRNQLLEGLYDTENNFIDDNTLSVYMKRLRDKLGQDALCIETVRGVGYRFQAQTK